MAVRQQPGSRLAPRQSQVDPREEALSRLIVALDVPDTQAASVLVSRLENTCRWFKVGLELFIAAGPGVVEMLTSRGYSVFLDLKLHDIPNTDRLRP